ncbi:MAG: O-antigen ligase family protein [Phycisphaerae bacterium]|jgi:O-antigen ligase
MAAAMIRRLTALDPLRRVFVFALPVLVGVIGVVATVQISAMRRRTLLILAVGGAILWAAFLTRRLREVLLFGWVLALTYNRNYFSFDNLIGNFESQGLYWIPADALFIGLLGLHACKRVIRRTGSVARSDSIWLWVAPFVAACALSTLFAEHKMWAAIEMVRIAKICLILWYIRATFTRREWWVAVLGLGCAVTLQGTYGLLQVATDGRFEFAALFGAGTAGGAALRAERSDLLQEWTRAVGTLGHPNLLAVYLLLTMPAFVSLALVARNARVRLVSTAAGLMGLAGIVGTLSRAAWAVAGIELVIVLAVVTITKGIRPKRAIGLLAVAGFAVAVAALPFTSQIVDRVTRDWSESVDFRAEYNRIAVRIFDRSPVVGVGLNSYGHYLSDHDPRAKKYLSDFEAIRRGINMRGILAVHNVYLLLLAETGVLGLSALLVWLVGAGVIARRIAATTDGYTRAVVIGLLIGVVGVSLHQLSGFSLWTDPNLYTFTLVFGLLSTVPATVAPPVPGPSLTPESSSQESKR